MDHLSTKNVRQYNMKEERLNNNFRVEKETPHCLSVIVLQLLSSLHINHCAISVFIISSCILIPFSKLCEIMECFFKGEFNCHSYSLLWSPNTCNAEQFKSYGSCFFHVDVF